jgi:hypothetical protein
VGFGRRQAIDARQEVAHDGLEVAIAEEAARQKICGVSSDGFESCRHQG